MRRWHQDLTISRREWRKHHRSHVESNKDRGKVGKDPYEVDCTCDEQVGRFRKKDAWDCGNSKCFLCSSHKFPKRTPHEQELISDLSFKEQLKEMDNDPGNR
jgi:hypothetical protein